MFRLMGDLLKNLTKYKFNVDISTTQDRKLMFQFANEMIFDEKVAGIKTNRQKPLNRLLKSPTTTAKSLRERSI